MERYFGWAAFLGYDMASKIWDKVHRPSYVYSEHVLLEQIEKIVSSVPAWTVVRYAMKANSNPFLIKLITDQGLYIDASSGYEVQHALRLGIPYDRIQLTSQEFADFLDDEFRQGVQFVACSLSQLERFGQKFPGHTVGIRCNPGVGSGMYGKVNTGGVTSSFGIWHESLLEAKAIAQKHNLRIVKLHTHIGSWSDPVTWMWVAHLSCEIAEQLPDVEVINLWWGFKIKRYHHEKETNMQEIFTVISEVFRQFSQKSWRTYKLEIEPGTYLVWNAWAILCQVWDIVNTGEEWYHFLKLTTGMDAILRPTMYGAQHPITILKNVSVDHPLGWSDTEEYVVVGHCCESWDLLTPELWNPEKISTRTLPKATIWDFVVIDGCGAYCAGMSAKWYNSFPSQPELLLRTTWHIEMI